ncbi:hypothetical protein BGZ80_010837 [Entomortierella chlamydospora]|uniref:NET domain-containing protein n=1 Tax=Entomortierella chlamydospora TaxID=101097 RepID=A0A9P6N357_9FUNG|nr:hypothetical protein BGZ80_010837 [Entomortierella chlamydospora]
MGGITFVDTSVEPESHTTILKNLSQAEALNQLALDASALVGQNLIQSQVQNQSSGSFSISDFLVPGLQSKAWEDWQVADELNPFATGMDSQDFTTDLAALPFQFGLDGMWDTTTAAGLPADQAYDEFVFDLTPSNFASPETVNVADLIVGPNSMAPSVSPQELAISSMPTDYNYEDLALANFYGFTEHDSVVSDSDLGSDLSEVDSSSDEEDDDDESEDEEEEDEIEVLAKAHDQICPKQTGPTEQNVVDVVESAAGQGHLSVEDLDVAISMSLTTKDSRESVAPQQQQEQEQRPRTESPNKRFMEETLVARINNDLGPEHMAGLFKILKGTVGQDDNDEDEDEEMEVDLSRLDEATLVELYQYVETCCMQTIKSIFTAKEQECKRAATAAAKAQQESLERARYLETRTPELSPSHSYSSASPSPPHPSFSSYNLNGCGSSNNKKRTATTSTLGTNYYERSGVEERTEALWMAAQHKSKRKRMINNSPACMGGGGTGKGRRIQKSFEQVQEDQDEDMEIGEDDEIDVVGI